MAVKKKKLVKSTPEPPQPPPGTKQMTPRIYPKGKDSTSNTDLEPRKKQKRPKKENRPMSYLDNKAYNRMIRQDDDLLGKMGSTFSDQWVNKTHYRKDGKPSIVKSPFKKRNYPGKT